MGSSSGLPIYYSPVFLLFMFLWLFGDCLPPLEGVSFLVFAAAPSTLGCATSKLPGEAPVSTSHIAIGVLVL